MVRLLKMKRSENMYQKIRQFYHFYDVKFPLRDYSKHELNTFVRLGEEMIVFHQEEIEKLKKDQDGIKKELLSFYIATFNLEELTTLPLLQKKQKIVDYEKKIEEYEKEKEKIKRLYRSKRKELKMLHNILNNMCGQNHYKYISSKEKTENNTKVFQKRALDNVYFIINRDNGWIKIGFSHDPKMRLASFKTEFSTKNMDILHTIPSGFQGKELENLYHVLLKKYQVRGEWFDIPEKIIPYLSYGNNLPSDFAECIWRMNFQLEYIKKADQRSAF